jgi:legumain
MNKLSFFLALLPFVLALAHAANWAVIMAGSSGYSNYRHQADACHAYQVVLKNGIPESNIILMMYDDVANARENPFPGQVFNKPTKAGEPGVDVYKGCKTDYTGKDVNQDTFLGVLTGDSNKAGGKVLKSTAQDKVFVNFVDHGGTGSIAMPDGKLLHAKDLLKGLQTMYDKKMYQKLVFYLEACESGSMFENILPKNISIFATTAANAKESSWGTYCPPYDKVDGKELHTCLGDLYSVNWMEDSDKASEQASETLSAQYDLVKKETNKSHVQEYGDMSFVSEKIHDYQGAANLMVRPISSQSPTTPEEQAAEQALKEASAVPSRDIPLVTKFYAYLRSPAGARDAQAKALIQEIQHRETADTIFAKLATAVSGDTSGALLTAHMPVTNHECQKEADEQVMQACGAFSDYSLKYTRLIANLCESGHTPATIAAAARAICA